MNKDEEAEEIIRRLKGYSTTMFLDDVAFFKHELYVSIEIPPEYFEARKKNDRR